MIIRYLLILAVLLVLWHSQVAAHSNTIARGYVNQHNLQTIDLLVSLKESHDTPRIVVDADQRERNQRLLSPPPEPPVPVLADRTTSRPVRVASTSGVGSTIVHWANYYGVSDTQLLRVASCESSYNPDAVNYTYYNGGNPTGLFQFLPDTFYEYATRAGIANPNILDPNQQAQAAAYAFSHGGSGDWECQ